MTLQAIFHKGLGARTLTQLLVQWPFPERRDQACLQPIQNVGLPAVIKEGLQPDLLQCLKLTLSSATVQDVAHICRHALPILLSRFIAAVVALQPEVLLLEQRLRHGEAQHATMCPEAIAPLVSMLGERLVSLLHVTHFCCIMLAVSQQQ